MDKSSTNTNAYGVSITLKKKDIFELNEDIVHEHRSWDLRARR